MGGSEQLERERRGAWTAAGMTRVHGHEELYVVTDALRQRCLEADDSLFTPGEPIWTAVAAAEVSTAVAEDDTSDREFVEKLSEHLAGVAPSAVRLGAEILYLMLLPESDTGEVRKMQHIERILSLLPNEVSVPSDLRKALQHGFAKYGQGGRVHRHEAVRYLARFARNLKALPAEERRSLLANPWAFEEFVAGVDSDRADTERSAFLHLVFPDDFESLVSRSVKERSRQPSPAMCRSREALSIDASGKSGQRWSQGTAVGSTIGSPA